MADAGRTRSGRGALGAPKALLKRPFTTLQEHLDRRADILEERFELLEKRLADESSRVILEGRRSALEDLGDIHLALEDLQRLGNSPPWTRLVGAELGELDDLSAAFLNYAGGEHGFAAQAGVAFVPPVHVAYRTGRADVERASSQLVEVPYAHAALRGLRRGAAILHLDGARSLMPYALASLGYAVTVVADSYAMAHPRLMVQPRAVVEREPAGEHYDGIVATSLAAPVSWESLVTLASLGGPGCLMVLCVPVSANNGADAGGASLASTVARYLGGWTVRDVTCARHVAPDRWDVSDGDGAVPADYVAMLTIEHAADRAET